MVALALTCTWRPRTTLVLIAHAGAHDCAGAQLDSSPEGRRGVHERRGSCPASSKASATRRRTDGDADADDVPRRPVAGAQEVVCRARGSVMDRAARRSRFSGERVVDHAHQLPLGDRPGTSCALTASMTSRTSRPKPPAPTTTSVCSRRHCRTAPTAPRSRRGRGRCLYSAPADARGRLRTVDRKRAFDLALTVPALRLSLPVQGASPPSCGAPGRPVLFRQERPGLRGEPFEMVKFRTMLRSTPTRPGRRRRPDDQARAVAARDQPRRAALPVEHRPRRHVARRSAAPPHAVPAALHGRAGPPARGATRA